MTYFSKTYFESREKFLLAAQRLENASHTAFFHPTEYADDGTRLSTDMIWIGEETAEKVVLVTSGLHGVEGFAGAAIQLKLLHDVASEGLPPHTALVLVHGVNPYGFAYCRRVNEDNIDLNRNFHDWQQPLPPRNPLNDALLALFLPEKWHWPTLLVKMLRFAVRHGMKGLQQALQGGQYAHKNAIFYGGTEAAWSNEVMGDIAARCAKHARKIVHIDVHTGLGKYGEAELIMHWPVSHPMGQRAQAWWGAERVRCAKEETSVSVKLTGGIEAVWHPFTDKAEITETCLEFGTRNRIAVLKALVFDNWVYATGRENTHAPQARQLMRDAFAPQDAAWENQIVATGVDIVNRAVAGVTV